MFFAIMNRFLPCNKHLDKIGRAQNLFRIIIVVFLLISIYPSPVQAAPLGRRTSYSPDFPSPNVYLTGLLVFFLLWSLAFCGWECAKPDTSEWFLRAQIAPSLVLLFIYFTMPPKLVGDNCSAGEIYEVNPDIGGIGTRVGVYTPQYLAIVLAFWAISKKHRLELKRSARDLRLVRMPL